MFYISQETKKGLFVSWSDDDNYESEPEDEVAKHVNALTGRYESDEDSCDEEISYEELVTCSHVVFVRTISSLPIEFYLQDRL